MKQRWKKPLSWLLALSMMLSLLPIMGVPALAAETNVSLDLTATAGEDATGDGWEWDNASQTLTLNGATFNIDIGMVDGDKAGICLPAGATISLSGSNTVTMTGSSKNYSAVCAIQGMGDLTIAGAGTLTVAANASSDAASDYSFGLMAITCNGTLTIGDGTDKPAIEATAGNAPTGSSYGIYASKLSLESGTITAQSGSASGNNAVSYGIYAGTLNEIKNGVEITASCGSATAKSIAFRFGYKYSNVPDWVGILTDATKTTIENGSAQSGMEDDTSDYSVRITQEDSSQPVSFTYGGTTPEPAADGLDFTTKATDENGDGWSWDASEKTLTLSGLNLTVTKGILGKGLSGASDLWTEAGILLPAGSTIALADRTENQISITASRGVGANRWEVCGIYVASDAGNAAALTITGNGTLKVSANASDSVNFTGDIDTYGIIASQQVTIGSGTDKPVIAATAGKATYSTYGIFSSYLYLKSGDITVASGERKGSNSSFNSAGIGGTLVEIKNGFKVTASNANADGWACNFTLLDSSYKDGILKNVTGGTGTMKSDSWMVLTQSATGMPLSFTYNDGSAAQKYTIPVKCYLSSDDGNTLTESTDVGTAAAAPAEAAVGDTITLTATANEGYTFWYWMYQNSKNYSKRVDPDESSITVTVPEDIGSDGAHYKAIFKKADPGYTLVDGHLTIKSDAGMEAWIQYYVNTTAATKPTVTSATIENGVTYIGTQAFVLSDVSSITIPDSVTEIKDQAFNSCYQLTSITIPVNVNKIGDYAFSNCTKLEKVTVQSATPAALGNGAFQYTKFVTSGIKGILVPDGKLETYKTEWSAYQDYIREQSTKPVTITGLKENYTKVYDGQPITNDVFGTPTVKLDSNGSEITAKDAKLTYTYFNQASEALSTPPTDAGTYSVVISASSDSGYIGTVKLWFTIEKAPVTVTMNEPVVNVGSTWAEVKAQLKPLLYSGFVGDGSTQPTFTREADYTLSADADLSKPGTYTYTVTPAEAANYTFTYSNCTFTVSDAYIATVSGTVTKDNSSVSDAAVTLTGSGVNKSTTTDSNGAYTFGKVKNGLYNLTVTSGEQTVTVLVEVKDGDIQQNVALPSSGVSSKIEVRADAPAIAKGAVVGGLDEVAKVNEDPNEKVEIKLELSKATDTTAEAAIKQLSAAAKKLLETFDLSVYKTVDSGTPSKLTETDTPLKIVIPYDTTRKGIAVFRYHGSAAQALTRLASVSATPIEGSFFVDTEHQCIIIYAGRFSTYAIGYTDPNGGSSGGSSGGGSSSGSSSSGGSYGIDVPAGIKGGSVSVSPKNAAKGSTVTVTVTPDKGYTLETLTVLDKDGKEVTLTEKNGRYTFTMPAGKVSVKASFMEDNTMLNFFTDVPASAYYYDAVLWAAEKGVTGGTSAVTFSPDAPCTRAQIVTFLWRAAGSPEPKALSSFSDVSADRYYAKAVAWAVENGIANGTKDGRFDPNAVCTRAQAVTFLHRASGAPAASGAGFSDVAANAYYAAAVAWASASGVTSGTKDGGFSPNTTCTRAQIVTFLYRASVK